MTLKLFVGHEFCHRTPQVFFSCWMARGHSSWYILGVRYETRFAEYYRRHLDALCVGAVREEETNLARWDFWEDLKEKNAKFDHFPTNSKISRFFVANPKKRCVNSYRFYEISTSNGGHKRSLGSFALSLRCTAPSDSQCTGAVWGTYKRWGDEIYWAMTKKINRSRSKSKRVGFLDFFWVFELFLTFSFFFLAFFCWGNWGLIRG